MSSFACIINVPGSVEGSILYHNGIQWVQLPPGVERQVLATGPSTPPYWTDLASLGKNHKIVDTTPYNLVITDDVLLVDTRVAAITINLDLLAIHDGHHILIKDYYGNAGTNNITLQAEVGETIDGANTYLLNRNYMAVWIAGDITNSWFIY